MPSWPLFATVLLLTVTQSRAVAQAIDPGWRVRQTDYEFLTSPQARTVLRDERITVFGEVPAGQALLRSGESKPGADALLVAFGAGLSWAAQVVKLPNWQ